MAASTPHNARRHASTFALELLAEEQSTNFDRSVVRAIYQIGCRDRPDASAAEWALLHLAEHLLELGREQVSEPIGTANPRTAAAVAAHLTWRSRQSPLL